MSQHRDPCAPDGAPDEVPSPQFWRTELLAPGPHGQRPGHWTLEVDGHLVASTPTALTNGGAHDWARREMGEGVRFEPIVFDDAAERALREGREIDWCANPVPGSWRPARVGGGE